MSAIDELIEALRADPDASRHELKLALRARGRWYDRLEVLIITALDSSSALRRRRHQ